MDRERDGAIFAEALRGATLLAICFGAAVWTLYRRLAAMPFMVTDVCA